MVSARIISVASTLLLLGAPALAEQIAIDIPNVALQTAASLELGIATITGRRNSSPELLEFVAGSVGVLGGKSLRAVDKKETLTVDFVAPIALDEINFDLVQGNIPFVDVGNVHLTATTIDGATLETALPCFGNQNFFLGTDVFPNAAPIVRLEMFTLGDVEASLGRMVVTPLGFAPGQRLHWKLAPGGFQQDAVFAGVPGMTLTLAFADVAPGSALAATVLDAKDSPVQFFTIAKNTKRKVKLNAAGVFRLRIADLSGAGATFSIVTGRKLPKSFSKSTVTVAPAFGQAVGVVPLTLLPGTEFTIAAAPKKPFAGQLGINVVNAAGKSLADVLVIAPLLGVGVSTAAHTSDAGGSFDIVILGFTTSAERVKVTLTRKAPAIAATVIPIG